MEVDKNKAEASLDKKEVSEAITSAINESLNKSSEQSRQELSEALTSVLRQEIGKKVDSELTKGVSTTKSTSSYKKLDELSPEEVKKIEATLAARLDNWVDDEDDAHEEVIKSFLLLAQFGAAILLFICTFIPRTSPVVGSVFNGLFISSLLAVSGLFVKKIYWQWAPLCSLLLTLCLSNYFVGRVVRFYHKDGFLSFLSIFISALIGLSTLVILWRIYKNKSMDL